MHEAAVTMALHEQVVSRLPPGTVLLSVDLRIGRLEHLDPEVMCAVWEAVVEGTPLEGSRLGFEVVPLRVLCRACGAEHSPEDPALLVCPSCGAVRPEVLEGSGIVLERLTARED